MGVGQGELLIGELLDHHSSLKEFAGVERVDRERGQVRDECQELDRAVVMIPAQKPAVTFGDDKADVTRAGGDENSPRNREQ